MTPAEGSPCRAEGNRPGSTTAARGAPLGRGGCGAIREYQQWVNNKEDLQRLKVEWARAQAAKPPPPPARPPAPIGAAK